MRHERRKFRKHSEAKNFISGAKDYLERVAQNRGGIEGAAGLTFVQNCLNKICDESRNSRNVILFENSFGRLVNTNSDGYGLFNVRFLTRNQKKTLQYLGETIEDLAIIDFLQRDENDEEKLDKDHEVFEIDYDLRADLLSLKILVFISEE